MITTYDEFLNENRKFSPEDFDIRKYKWNQGKLDVFETVGLGVKNQGKIPFKFGKVDGDFYINNNHLTSLDGCPEIIYGSFFCNGNQIENLEAGPKIVRDNYHCHDNKLTSLVGSPKIIHGNFSCYHNELTSLLGGPENVYGNFLCYENKLTNLDFCPVKTTHDFYCSINPLKSIEAYPLCDIGGNISDMHNFRDVYYLVKNNKEIFLPLLNDKTKFHQMVMRLKPDLIQYYTTIQPPSKKTML